jgi:tRNA threonylcarbamoyladenosine biosynthesis protein TsaE
MKAVVTTHSPTETEALAKRLGKNLRGGEVIELVSDLGGGKTTLVRGLAEGFGSDDKVASPTFTVSKVYKAGKKELHHFDFYRLSDPGILAYELHDLVGDPLAVTVIEWADVAHHVLPEERLTIRLKRTGDEERELSFEYPETLKYLLEGIC